MYVEILEVQFLDSFRKLKANILKPLEIEYYNNALKIQDVMYTVCVCVCLCYVCMYYTCNQYT